MERFAWSFNGIKFSDAEPLRLTCRKHLRIVLVNDTMMMHPIHLHGMWSDLEDDQRQIAPYVGVTWRNKANARLIRPH